MNACAENPSGSAAAAKASSDEARMGSAPRITEMTPPRSMRERASGDSAASFLTHRSSAKGGAPVVT